ncbi:MAG: GntR family transcriptional regulator [Desulfotomaculales bacterium]
MRAEAGLGEEAYRIIKEKLATYENGKYLSARALSNEIGMSYTPVREALLRLQREGLLRRIPNVGFFVVNLDTRDIEEIFQVRKCLEKFVFEAVFHLISEHEIQEMEKLLEKQKKALKKGDIKEYIKADEKFHFIFFQMYNNKHFIAYIKNVREHYLLCSSKVATKGGTEGIDEHIQLLNEIKAGNKEQAEKCLMLHLENACQRMKEGYVHVRNYTP